MIGKTGTLGNGNLASEAWFVGAIPQYAMAIGLWTNTQAQNLDNLPSLGGIGGSFGGAWPAATWKTFMETKFASLPVEQLPTPDYAGFTKWIQVAPQKRRRSRPASRVSGRTAAARRPELPAEPEPVVPAGRFGQPCDPIAVAAAVLRVPGPELLAVADAITADLPAAGSAVRRRRGGPCGDSRGTVVRIHRIRSAYRCAVAGRRSHSRAGMAISRAAFVGSRKQPA